MHQALLLLMVFRMQSTRAKLAEGDLKAEFAEALEKTTGSSALNTSAHWRGYLEGLENAGLVQVSTAGRNRYVNTRLEPASVLPYLGTHKTQVFKAFLPADAKAAQGRA